MFGVGARCVNVEIQSTCFDLCRIFVKKHVSRLFVVSYSIVVTSRLMIRCFVGSSVLALVFSLSMGSSSTLPVLGSFLTQHFVHDWALGISSLDNGMYLTCRTGRSTHKSFFSSPSVRNLDSSSAACCFAPAWWVISNLKSDSHRRHCASVPNASARLGIHFSESCLMYILKRVPSKYGRWSSNAITMARHFRGVVSYTLSALVSEREHYSIGFVVLLGCFWSNKRVTSPSQASASNVICPSAYGSATNGGNVSFSWKLFIA